jgi:hypothetical protein
VLSGGVVLEEHNKQQHDTKTAADSLLSQQV